MRYKKAPILEAALEFRWARHITLDAVRAVVNQDAFSGFGPPKDRTFFNATFDLQGGEIDRQSKHVGFELAVKDGSEIAILETDKFVYVKRAPYDRWKTFSERALSLLRPAAKSLGVTEFSRIGVRFVNRLDIPHAGVAGYNTDDYITVVCDGPRIDRGVIDEFQMRVVKPSQVDGISYALVVATTPSLLPAHGSIVLDIDVFSAGTTSASGGAVEKLLSTMREEKNDIFHKCLKPRAIELFGGIEE